MKPTRLPAIVGFIAAFALAFVVMAGIQWNPNNPYLSEYDGYYHVKMAELIRDNGISRTFPHLQFTTLRDDYVNHHLLFHLLLIPFISLLGPITGAKLAVVTIVSSAFGVLFLLYRRLQVPAPFIATAATLLLMAGDFYFRMNFVRNMGLSLLLLLLGTLATIRDKPFHLGIVTYLYGLAYGGSFFLPIFVAAYAAVRFLSGEKVPYRLLAASGTGFVAGLVINPYFPANLRFLWLQIFQTGLGAQGYVGGEWQPYDAWFWARTNAAALTLWAAGILSALLGRARQNAASLSLFLLAIVFLVLTWKSKRFVEYSPLFLAASAFALGAPVLADLRDQWNNGTWKRSRLFLSAMVIVALLTPFALEYAQTQLSQARRDTQTLFSMNALRRVHAYLQQHSAPGDIVFTDDWDVFPKYFFLNTHNYYIVGLDPEFMNQYRGQPYPGVPGRLYREFAEISSGEDPTRLERIKTNFRARYVIVANDHPAFARNLQARPDLFREVLYAENDPTVDRSPLAQGDGYRLFEVL